MSLRPLLLAAIFAALGLPVIAGDTYQVIPFSALNGWQDDDHAAATRVEFHSKAILVGTFETNF